MQPQELLKRMKSNKPPAIIDVRTGFEFRAGHIPGAIHAPTWKILMKMVNIPSDRSAELVVLCELGPRALIARGLLGLYGYRNVTLLEGHMAGWRQSGRALEK